MSFLTSLCISHHFYLLREFSSVESDSENAFFSQNKRDIHRGKGDPAYLPDWIHTVLLHFVAFFHVASLFSTGVDNKKVGVDNEKALELTNSTVFHRGSSGVPEAEIFGRKRKFSPFGFRFRPPKLKAEPGRKSNFRIFSKWSPFDAFKTLRFT